MSNELAANGASEVARVADSESAQLIGALIRAAANPEISAEKMNALFDLHVRVQERAARLEFTAALARAAAKFPTVERRGKIVVFSKADRERPGGPPKDAKPIQETPYPLYEDIRDAITGPLSAEGLTLSFEVRTVPIGDSYRIIVVGHLRHRDGHEEVAETPPMVHDSTGSKNAVQAVKSTVSYGKRMVAELLTNVASRGDDDDAISAGYSASEDVISSAQYDEIAAEITSQGGRTLQAILDAFGVLSLSDLPASRYTECVNRLAQRRANAAKQAGGR